MASQVPMPLIIAPADMQNEWFETMKELSAQEWKECLNEALRRMGPGHAPKPFVSQWLAALRSHVTSRLRKAGREKQKLIWALHEQKKTAEALQQKLNEAHYQLDRQKVILDSHGIKIDRLYARCHWHRRHEGMPINLEHET